MFQKPVRWGCSVDSLTTFSFLQAKGSSQFQWVVSCVVALPFRLVAIEGYSPFCLAYRSNSFQFSINGSSLRLPFRLVSLGSCCGSETSFIHWGFVKRIDVSNRLWWLPGANKRDRNTTLCLFKDHANRWVETILYDFKWL